MKIILTIVFLFPFLVWAQCSHNVITLSQTDPTAHEIYRPNGISVLPGDTIKIPSLGATVYSLVQLDTILGTRACPITIKPSGTTPVQILNFRFATSHICHFVNFDGSGIPGYKYGFNLGVLSISFLDHTDIKFIEAHDQNNGFFFHVNPNGSDPKSQFQGGTSYVTRKYSIHDNYIHNTNNEGMYIGHTYPFADPYSGNLTPIRMDSIDIYNNIVFNTGWDGIQLSNAQDGCSIHGNTVINFGLQDAGSQRAGIIMGANSQGRIYKNVVRHGTGNGIQHFGYSVAEVDSNQVEDVGNTHDDGCNGCLGEQSIFTKAAKNIETRPKQVVYVHDNSIEAPHPRGTLTTNNDANYSDTAKFINNYVYFPRGVPGSWLTNPYISMAQVNKVISGNYSLSGRNLFFLKPQINKIK